MNFLVAGQSNPHILKYTDASTWIGDVKRYILDVNGELVLDRTLVFVIQSEIFMTNTDPKRAVSVMVSLICTHLNTVLIFNYFNYQYKKFLIFQVIYNGEGQVLKWIIVSEGSLLTYEWTEANECNGLFLITSDGTMTSTTLRNALIVVKRYT